MICWKLRRGPNPFRFNTNKFGVLAEETTDEIPHIEQHDTTNTITTTSEAVEVANRDERRYMQPFTTGDAIDIAFQKRHAKRQNPKGDEKNSKSTGMSFWWKVLSTGQDKGSTTMTEDGRGQKIKGKETARVETQIS